MDRDARWWALADERLEDGPQDLIHHQLVCDPHIIPEAWKLQGVRESLLPLAISSLRLEKDSESGVLDLALL